MPVALALADVVDEDELGVVDVEDVFEDIVDAVVVETEVVKGLEKVEGKVVGKEREVLVDASAQNCWAMFSAAERSLGQEVEMHPTSTEVKRVELRVSGVFRADYEHSGVEWWIRDHGCEMYRSG